MKLFLLRSMIERQSAYILIALLFSITTISDLPAQPRLQPRSQQGALDFIFINAVTLPSENSERSTLDIHYRIMKNFFIFIKTSDPDILHPFIGGGEIAIEIFDTRGQAVTREVRRERIYSEIARPEIPNAEHIQGAFRFELHPGEYRLYIRVSDDNSSREFVDKDRRISVDSFPEMRLNLSDIIFAEPANDTTFRIINAGGNVLFGKDFDALFAFSTGADSERRPTTTVSLIRQRDRHEEPETVFTDTLNNMRLFSGSTVAIKEDTSGRSYHIEESGRPDISIGSFSLPGRRLEEGTYQLKLTMNDGIESKEKTQTFRVIWIDKPISLRNFDFALEMMEYILPEDDYRQLRRGSQAERREKFNRYWKEKDPDPSGAVNPVLTEYYRRVDHAMQEFQTLRQRNGARTDRGKIYIIYGPPTRTDRSLAPGQFPQETWIYTHLNQKFIFVDQSRQGNYQLVAREEL